MWIKKLKGNVVLFFEECSKVHYYWFTQKEKSRIASLKGQHKSNELVISDMQKIV